MANQIIIDIGAVANDGTGDPLRTAFGFVNNNFSNVWASGVTTSNIAFDGNRILTTNTNGNLVLAPNGIGKVQSNVDIVPSANNALSLGSLTRQWNTVYAQDLAVSGDTTFNNLTVEGNLTVDGDIIQIGNLVTDAKTIQLANTAGTDAAANGSGITVGANDDVATLLYNSSNNVWTTNIGISTVGNVTAPYFIGNGSQLTGVTSYSNANVDAHLSGSAGNIIPVGNNAQSLGNATNQWADLWVSNSTIYMNSVPITLGAGNVLTVNGEALLSNDSNTSISTTGNITADFFIGDGSQLTNLPFDASQIENGTSNVAIATANGNVTITSAGAETWTFSTSGNLRFPDGTTYTGSEIDSPTVPTIGGTASAGEAGITYLSGDLSKWAIFTEGAFTVGVWTDVQVGWTVTDNNGFTDIIAGRGSFGAASFQTTVNSWPAPASGKTYVFTSPDYQLGYTNPVEITVGNNTWSFGNTSTLTLPGGSQLSPLGANLDIIAGTGAYVNLTTSDESSRMGVDNGGGYIVTAGGTWNFDAAGNLTLPGNIIAINYLNGNRVTGGITFDGEAVIGTGTSNTQSGLYLAPDPVSLANDLYLRVRGNILDEPTHIHFDTGNNQYYNQFIGDDNKYVQLANTGNIVINTNNYAGNTAQWTFSTDGLLTLPAGSSRITSYGQITIETDNNASGMYLNADSVNLLYANANVTLRANSTGTNKDWNFGSDGNLNYPDGTISTGGAVYAAANASVAMISNNEHNQVRVDNDYVEIFTSLNGITLKTWQFGNTGALTVPGNISFVGEFNNAAPSLNNFASITSAANFAVTIDSADTAPTWSFETGDSALGEFDESPLLRTPAGAGSVIYNETLMAILAGNIDAGERSSVRLLEGGVSLLGTTSLDGELSTIIMEVNTGGVGIRALGDAAPRLSVTGNVTGGNILTAGSVTANGNVTGGNISTAGTVSATGNLTANNISTGNVTATRVQNGGNLEIRSNVAGTVKVWTFDAIGDLNLPFGGNIVGTGGILANTGTFTGNVTAANFEGNITITGNVTGTSANVDLVAGVYEWSFDNEGNLTLPGNSFAVNYANNTPVDVVTRFEDVWTVPTGNSTQSFTVDGNNSYQMWVEGNIPNGIIAWNATVTVTNTNVPVIGQQFAWNYEGGGNILMFNSIPAQIIGTAGSISNAEPAVGNTTNVFSFGINNASGNVANVRYGWIKIS
jgi:hypothetical protein